MRLSFSIGITPHGRDVSHTFSSLNDRYRDSALDTDTMYLGLWDVLSQVDGSSRKGPTFDGLHSNGLGYRIWVDAYCPTSSPSAICFESWVARLRSQLTTRTIP